MKEFPFPSLSLLKKITEGKLDAVKCATTLKLQGAISEDVVLMFDEMYLQKCEEYSAGEIIGANENNELYKGLLSFMIVGLKENVPYVKNCFIENTFFLFLNLRKYMKSS